MGTWVSTDYGLIKLTVQLVQDQFEKSSNKSVMNSKMANQLHNQHQHKQLTKRFAGLYSITKTCYVALFLKVKKEFS